MADDSDSTGGFGWGLVVGLALGLVAGAFLASGPGREQGDTLRQRTIELTGSARRGASAPEHPPGRALNDGVSAAPPRPAEPGRAARPPPPAGGGGAARAPQALGAPR